MKQSGWGIASLVCGIAGVLLACVVIGIFPAIVGIVFAIIAFVQKNRGAWNGYRRFGMFNSRNYYFLFSNVCIYKR